jgi:hypothetical protein
MTVMDVLKKLDISDADMAKTIEALVVSLAGKDFKKHFTGIFTTQSVALTKEQPVKLRGLIFGTMSAFVWFHEHYVDLELGDLLIDFLTSCFEANEQGCPTFDTKFTGEFNDMTPTLVFFCARRLPDFFHDMEKKCEKSGSLEKSPLAQQIVSKLAIHRYCNRPLRDQLRMLRHETESKEKKCFEKGPIKISP